MMVFCNIFQIFPVTLFNFRLLVIIMKQIILLLIALVFIATTVNAHSEEECGKNYCNVNISISTDKEQYNDNEKITFYNEANK